MRQHRFFVGQDLSKFLGQNPAVFDFDPDTTDFEPKDAIVSHQHEIIRQWKKVFRYEPGAEVILFDGKIEYEAKILELSKKDETARLVLEKEVRATHNDKTGVWLGLAILKGEHTDMVIEKATELGVRGVILFQSDRVVKKGVNLERLRKIAIEAAEQCGRIDVPTIDVCGNIEELLNKDSFDQKVILDMDGERVKGSTKENTLICIGPEGGWSDDERKIFKARKDVVIESLGENVLRAETAAILGAGALYLKF
ncbi:MAG: RsmE family RNA methyltransferase [bacterium]